MNDIKAIREATGLSQGNFAKALNIPTPSLQKWERGGSRPPEYVIELIAYRVQHDPAFKVTE